MSAGEQQSDPPRRRPRWLLAVVLGCALALGVATLADAAPKPPKPGHGADRSLGGATGCGGEAPRKANGTRWSCTFSDDFDGTSLDRSKWGVVRTDQIAFHSGSECFVDQPDVVSVSDGHLDLSVRATDAPFLCATRPDGSDGYESQAVAGSVTTQNTFAQTYGRYQIRARFPSAKVPGLQSALWLFPTKLTATLTGTDYGEIDIAEFYTKYPDRVIPTLHYTPQILTRQVQTNYNCLVSDPDQFHTYTLEWTSRSISIWYDDQLCLQNVNWQPMFPLRHPAPFDKPFMLLLTQALGVGANAPTADTPLPGTTEVDWVHVWK